jgi:hypothetical protein
MAKIPTVKHNYDLPRVQALREEMCEVVLQDFGHETCEGDRFDLLVDTFASCLPSTVNKETLFHALRHLAGVKLTPKIIDDTSWRLAGNIPRLKEMSVPIGPWTRQAYKEWVPAQVTDALHCRNDRNRPGWMMTFKILAGTPCPMEIEQHWSRRLCTYAAFRLGFCFRHPDPKSEEPMQGGYLHPTELVLMRVLLLIDPDLCDAEPDFKEFSATPSVLEWNRTQLRFRDRASAKYKCPKGYPAANYCYRCPVGYEECRAATHPRTYTAGVCPRCKSGNVPFDKGRSDDECVFCLEKQAMQKR